jgi:hypothetical protein
MPHLIVREEPDSGPHPTRTRRTQVPGTPPYRPPKGATPILTTLPNGRLQRLGWLDGHAFHANKRERDHLLRMKDAWCLDRPTYLRLQREGATEWVIHGDEATYRITFMTANATGFVYESERGSDRQQWAVPRRYWYIDERQADLFSEPPECECGNTGVIPNPSNPNDGDPCPTCRERRMNV